jgi:hypothetical protein
MATFLFVTASVAVVLGLVGLVVGYMPRRAGRPQAPRASVPTRAARLTAMALRDGRTLSLIGGNK